MKKILSFAMIITILATIALPVSAEDSGNININTYKEIIQRANDMYGVEIGMPVADPSTLGTRSAKTPDYKFTPEELALFEKEIFEYAAETAKYNKEAEEKWNAVLNGTADPDSTMSNGLSITPKAYPSDYLKTWRRPVDGGVGNCEAFIRTVNGTSYINRFNHFEIRPNTRTYQLGSTVYEMDRYDHLIWNNSQNVFIRAYGTYLKYVLVIGYAPSARQYTFEHNANYN